MLNLTFSRYLRGAGRAVSWSQLEKGPQAKEGPTRASSPERTRRRSRWPSPAAGTSGTRLSTVWRCGPGAGGQVVSELPAQNRAATPAKHPALCVRARPAALAAPTAAAEHAAARRGATGGRQHKKCHGPRDAVPFHAPAGGCSPHCGAGHCPPDAPGAAEARRGAAEERSAGRRGARKGSSPLRRPGRGRRCGDSRRRAALRNSGGHRPVGNLVQRKGRHSPCRGPTL
jgi:hypothetical protein